MMTHWNVIVAIVESPGLKAGIDFGPKNVHGPSFRLNPTTNGVALWYSVLQVTTMGTR